MEVTNCDVQFLKKMGLCRAPYAFTENGVAMLSNVLKSKHAIEVNIKSSQKNMDFTPAMPDIVVHNNPDDKAKGKDSQLKKAVEELLKDL